MDGNIDTAANVLHVSNINLQTASGRAAIHWACVYGHVEIVRMLLAEFASTDFTDDNRGTPAMYAESYGHTKVLSYLRCTLTASPNIRVHVPDSNNTVSLSVLSVEDANKSTSSDKTGHSKAKVSKIRYV